MVTFGIRVHLARGVWLLYYIVLGSFSEPLELRLYWTTDWHCLQQPSWQNHKTGKFVLVKMSYLHFSGQMEIMKP